LPLAVGLLESRDLPRSFHRVSRLEFVLFHNLRCTLFKFDHLAVLHKDLFSLTDEATFLAHFGYDLFEGESEGSHLCYFVEGSIPELAEVYLIGAVGHFNFESGVDQADFLDVLEGSAGGFLERVTFLEAEEESDDNLEHLDVSLSRLWSTYSNFDFRKRTISLSPSSMGMAAWRRLS
jgi:hypothetical protein